jgi:hypothetical protein
LVEKRFPGENSQADFSTGHIHYSLSDITYQFKKKVLFEADSEGCPDVPCVALDKTRTVTKYPERILYLP